MFRGNKTLLVLKSKKNATELGRLLKDSADVVTWVGVDTQLPGRSYEKIYIQYPNVDDFTLYDYTVETFNQKVVGEASTRLAPSGSMGFL